MGKYASTSVIACYLDNGKLAKTYKSAKDASEDLHLFSRTIDKAIRNSTRVKGYRWIRYMDNNDVKTSIEPYVSSSYKKDNIEVEKLDENGNILEIYPSIRKAAKENNISHKQIREVLLGHQKKAGGFYWLEVKKDK